MEKNIKVTKDVTVTIDGESQDGIMHIRTQTDTGFVKLWVDMMMVALGIAGKKKGAVISYFLKNRGFDNRVHGSFDEIADAANVARGTVASTMKAMQNAGLITRERDGVYLVNPDWVWSGHHSQRLIVMMEFNKLRYPSQKSYELGNHAPVPKEQSAKKNAI